MWFDREELAKVLEKTAGKGHGAKTVSTAASRLAGKAELDYGRWSAMFHAGRDHASREATALRRAEMDAERR